MKPYSLLIVSELNPATFDEIHSSVQMTLWAIWKELSKREYVTLSFLPDAPRQQSTEEWKASIRAQSSDFTLVSSYYDAPVMQDLNLLRSTTKQQVMWLSECFYGDLDHNFTYLPSNGTVVPLPALKTELQESMNGIEKIPGSILLDHAYYLDPKWVSDFVWCNRLYEWFEPLKDKIQIAQLERPEHEAKAGVVIPAWIKRIPGLTYKDYLRATAPYENFVMTHPGSYEHSIIDMVVRGIRVLSPVVNGISFAPADTVQKLKLQTFSNRDELLTLLSQPLDEGWRADVCNDASKLAEAIDAHCQGEINGRNS